MNLLRQSSGPPMSSPQRVALFIAALALWIFNIILIYNHQLAVERLPANPPSADSDGVVHQSTDYSCGPASLATLLNYYNIVHSEREYAELAGTSLTLGTRLSGLRRAGHSLGFQTVELSPTFDQLDYIAWPSIIFHSRLYHIVTYWGIDPDGNAIIRDPALGLTAWTSEQYMLNTPYEPRMLVYYPGVISLCDRDSSPIATARFQNMLRSLGYYSGPIDGAWSERLSRAIRSFQAGMGLDITGIIDAATSIFIEGKWKYETLGPSGPFMAIDRADVSSGPATASAASNSPDDHHGYTIPPNRNDY
jgi:hypothetical protein